MRKVLLFIFFALVVSAGANAGNVPEKVAARKAAAFLNLKSMTQLQLLESGYETMYLFAVQGGGFVVVSADNSVQPILGYSRVSNLDTKRLPLNLASWLDGCDSQIRAAAAAQLPMHEGWNEEFKRVDGFDSIVGPLLTTTWNQEPLYNDLCPGDADGQTMTGCVATAMAQVMKYWNWPDTGVGQHDYYTYLYGNVSADFGSTAYDWANMPSELTLSSSSAEVFAVATLMYHCGVATNTSYATYWYGGSAAFDLSIDDGLDYPCAENALRTYFKYSAALKGMNRIAFSDSAWIAMLKHELDCRRPVMYGGGLGYDAHEFVCDGYDTNGLFHFNWGFSGDGDGFFALNNLNPLPGYSFNANQKAIVGIEPDTLWGSDTPCRVTGLSCDTTMGSVVGSGVYAYRDTVYLRAVPIAGYRFLQWDNGSKMNPYPLLAHNGEMTAFFSDALVERGEILSYTGTDVSQTNPYSLETTDRIGIKFPASVLPGHNYVSAVDCYHHKGSFVAYVYRGGEHAPGELLYQQPFKIDHVDNRWVRVKFECPVPIDTTENLWIIIRSLEQTSLQGIAGIGVSDANWFSIDEGATWCHLSDIPTEWRAMDTSVSWFIRCVTAQDSVMDSTLKPTAFIIGPEKCFVGDTVDVEILHSSSSTVDWDFTGTAWSDHAGDTARVVWDSEGYKTLEADVFGFGGTARTSMSTIVADCHTPISVFPYELDFYELDEIEELKIVCWQILSVGEDHGYRFGNQFSVMLKPLVDYWFISPLIDLSGDGDILLKLNYSSDETGIITMELSQGGLDSTDFTTIYTLPVDVPNNTININLSEYYQGNPVRVALRIRARPDASYNRFDINNLRIYNTLGIDDNKAPKLIAYPNPSHGTVTVSLPETDGTLSLFDAAGRRLMQRCTDSMQATLDVTSLPQGIYMLQYTSSRGTTVTRLAIQ
jgi:hypothetical protein